VWETLERYWKPLREKREGARIGLSLRQMQRSGWWTAGTQEGFPGCRTPGEAAGGPGIDSELCARCRVTSMADSYAQEIPVKVRSGAAAEPSGVTFGRGTYQVVQPRLRSIRLSARRMLKALAEGDTGPVALAALADERLRATPEQLCDALDARTEFHAVYRRLLRMALGALRLMPDGCRLIDDRRTDRRTGQGDGQSAQRAPRCRSAAGGQA